jgi:CubicO group peptidase (beta-lactamase class C family)
MRSDKKLGELGDWLDRLHAEDGFNGTVLLACDSAVALKRHYGFADFERGIPLSAKSSFSLASVSKPFTALAVMLQAHAGKLALDDPLAKYIPELPGAGTMTLRHLLHHTSGIADHIELADEVCDPNVVLTIEGLIALFQEHRPRPLFPPGREFEYSNTGYALLGEVVARTAGTSYPQFMEQAVFGPLGMTDSAAFNLASAQCTLRQRVFGFRRHRGQNLPCDLNFLDGVYGDGGIYSSAEDLVRWDRALREGTLLPLAVYQEAYVSGRLNNGEATGYGFGWEIEPDNVVEHWGEWEGFTAFIRRDLVRHTLLVVLSNLGPSSEVDPVCSELSRLVAGLPRAD